MRKTQLWSKKESTPDYYDAKVTYDGRPTHIKITNKSSVVGRAKRFTQYEDDSKKLGTEVGPATYHQFHNCIYASRPKGTPMYKKFYRQRDLSDNWYFSVNLSYSKPINLRKTF